MSHERAIVKQGRRRDPGVFAGDWLAAPLGTHFSPALAKFGGSRDHEIAAERRFQECSLSFAPTSADGALIQLGHRHEGHGQNMPFQVGTIDFRERMAFQQVRYDVCIENPCGHGLCPCLSAFSQSRQERLQLGIVPPQIRPLTQDFIQILDGTDTLFRRQFLKRLRLPEISRWFLGRGTKSCRLPRSMR